MHAMTLAALMAVLAAPLAAQTFDSGAGPLRVERIAGGLEHPWSLAFLPDGRLLVTERPGRLRLIDGGMLSAPLAGVPQVFDSGQGGMFDVALAPDFAETGELYLSFAEPAFGGARTSVARARLTDGGLLDVAVIFRQSAVRGGGRHFGGRIVVAPDGTLFVTTGDRGAGEPAQRLDDHAGKVLRIDPDGAIPADNPFVSTPSAAPEVWSLGHRNIQGAALDAQGRLWTVEHGARGGDEINRPEPGLNYGWPVISYGVHYSGAAIGEGTHKAGMEQPAFWWDPSIAPSGLTVYDGGLFREWRGDILVGALRGELISRVEMEDGAPTGAEERLFEGAFGRIRDVRTGPDGAVWFLTDEGDGGVFRVTPAQ